MAYCKSCGSTLGDYDQVCTTCGASVPDASQPAERAETHPATHDSYTPDTSPVVGSWGFVGAILLLNLPVVGFVLSIVWAAGAVSNKNLRNLARAYLLLLLLFLAVVLSLLLTVFARFGSLMVGLNYLIGLFR